jgi:hypothetical protein
LAEQILVNVSGLSFMDNFLTEYFKLPEDISNSWCYGELGLEKGFFRFASNSICYGQCRKGTPLGDINDELYDTTRDVSVEKGQVCFPFDPAALINNLRMERYKENLPAIVKGSLVNHAIIRKGYYAVRELLPVAIRRHLQRIYFRDWKSLTFPAWPVDCTVDQLHREFLRVLMLAQGIDKVPFIWFWPEGFSSCLIMTHDVETASGVAFAPRLMDIDDTYGLKASFQVIPEGRYEFADAFVSQIRNRGFEFNIHDLNHDGQLFKEHREFTRRVARINEYGQQYGARGFRSGAMYRNQDWLQEFNFSYDMSVPTVAHLEPMRGGCCTVMPYFVGKILEIPLTASQDYTVMCILNDYSTDLWKTQIDLILQQNGLINFISHPDYLIDMRARNVYIGLLKYLQQLVKVQRIWTPLPGQLDEWWRARSKMRLVCHGSDWQIDGPQAERAAIAFAEIRDGRLVYVVPQRSTSSSTAPFSSTTRTPTA